MDETGVLGLLEELSILLEDSKPVFGKNNLRQVDVSAAFEIIDTPSSFGPELKEGLGQQCLHIQRVHLLEKARTAYAEIYIPGKYGANFTKADVESRTIYQLYEKKLHMQLGRGKQTIRASSQAAKALQIPEGWPVLSIRRRAYNAQGELVEYMIMTYEYTQYSFDVELNLSSR